MSTAADDVLELKLAAEPAKPKIANVPGRLGPDWLNRVRAVAGIPWKRRLAHAALVIPRVRAFEKQFLPLNDEDMRKASMRLRGIARGGVKLDRLIPEAFGLCFAAIRRIHGFQPFDVQLAAGIVMHNGGLVELATGEGKTLSAVAAGVPQRPAGQGRPRHHRQRLPGQARRRGHGAGLPPAGPVGRLHPAEDAGRRTARPPTSCDITYGTASEFGFDFLRDRLKVRGGQGAGPRRSGPRGWATPATPTRDVQRELHYAIVDEADSIFIDEARTPLIIANPTRLATPEEQQVYLWADGVARQMQPRRALPPRPEEAQDRADRRRPLPGALLQPAVGPALARHGQADRGRREGAARLPPVPPRPALHGQQGEQDRHHRRVHRPADARPPLARRPAPGGRGQGGRADQHAVRPRRPDHLPELLPALQEAGRHDRHG